MGRQSARRCCWDACLFVCLFVRFDIPHSNTFGTRSNPLTRDRMNKRLNKWNSHLFRNISTTNGTHTHWREREWERKRYQQTYSVKYELFVVLVLALSRRKTRRWKIKLSDFARQPKSWKPKWKQNHLQFVAQTLAWINFDFDWFQRLFGNFSFFIHPQLIISVADDAGLFLPHRWCHNFSLSRFFPRVFDDCGVSAVSARLRFIRFVHQLPASEKQWFGIISNDLGESCGSLFIRQNL